MVCAALIWAMPLGLCHPGNRRGQTSTGLQPLLQARRMLLQWKASLIRAPRKSNVARVLRSKSSPSDGNILKLTNVETIW